MNNFEKKDAYLMVVIGIFITIVNNTVNESLTISKNEITPCLFLNIAAMGLIWGIAYYKISKIKFITFTSIFTILFIISFIFLYQININLAIGILLVTLPMIYILSYLNFKYWQPNYYFKYQKNKNKNNIN